MSGAEQSTVATTTAPPPSADSRILRRDVEGLRAIAITVVVLYHFRFGPFLGGNVGVDIFFVISGFVITSMLLREREGKGHTSLLEFYARRIRRLLPAASLVIIATLVASAIWLPAFAVRSFAADARSAIFLYSNYHIAQTAGVFHASTGLYKPLSNYWTLSIEEQFYLVWPALFAALIALAGAIRSRVTLGSVLTLVFVSSMVLSAWWTPINRNDAYFSTLIRAGELALGALVAVALPSLDRMPRWFAVPATWIGASLAFASALVIRHAINVPGTIILLPILATALAIAAGNAAGSLGAVRLLGTRLFVLVGAISFSVYLWHEPVIVLAEDKLGHVPSLGWRLVLVALTLCLSIGCYALVENPIRFNRALRTHRGWTYAMGAALLLVTLSTTYLVT